MPDESGQLLTVVIRIDQRKALGLLEALDRGVGQQPAVRALAGQQPRARGAATRS